MKLLAPAVAAGLLFSAGCVQIHTSPATPRAETVDVEVSMAAGKLKLSGGAEALLEAETRYAPDSWRPEIRYDVTGFRGRLSVRHPNHSGIAGRTVADWDLRLNQDTPLDVKVKLGAGELRLDLGSLTLRNLEVELGAGSLRLDLTGTPKKTMDVKVRGGVGVEVEARGGIGEITASGLRKSGDLYRTAPAQRGKVAMRVSVHGGIGAIRLIAE